MTLRVRVSGDPHLGKCLFCDHPLGDGVFSGLELCSLDKAQSQEGVSEITSSSSLLCALSKSGNYFLNR